MSCSVVFHSILFSGFVSFKFWLVSLSFFLPVLHVNKADADKSWTLDEAAQNLSQSRPGERCPRWKMNLSGKLIAFDLGALLDRPAVYDVRYDVTWVTPLAKTVRFKVRTASGRNVVNFSLWWNVVRQSPLVRLFLPSLRIPHATQIVDTLLNHPYPKGNLFIPCPCITHERPGWGCVSGPC